MPICKFCGGDIVFRREQGQVVPIHLSGGYCSGGESSSSSANATHSFSRFCTKTDCKICGEEIFYIEHNGGRFFVDELGWPWPKHGCYQERKLPSWAEYMASNLPEGSKNNSFAGIVVHCDRISNEPPRMALGIDGGDQGKVIVATEADVSRSYLLGAFVVIDMKSKNIVCSTHDVKKLRNRRVSAYAAGLPQGWNTTDLLSNFSVKD